MLAGRCWRDDAGGTTETGAPKGDDCTTSHRRFCFAGPVPSGSNTSNRTGGPDVSPVRFRAALIASAIMIGAACTSPASGRPLPDHPVVSCSATVLAAGDLAEPGAAIVATGTRAIALKPDRVFLLGNNHYRRDSDRLSRRLRHDALGVAAVGYSSRVAAGGAPTRSTRRKAWPPRCSGSSRTSLPTRRPTSWLTGTSRCGPSGNTTTPLDGPVDQCRPWAHGGRPAAL